MNNNEVIILKDGEIEVKTSEAQDEVTVWLSQKQIDVLFDKDKKKIIHIQNVYKVYELVENQVCSFLCILLIII